jgi:hypothetical protein
LDYLLFTPVIRIRHPKSWTIVFGNWHFPFDLIDCAPARYTSHDTQVRHSISMALVISLRGTADQTYTFHILGIPGPPCLFRS